MTARPSLFILAGEASGDVIGADLIKSLAGKQHIKIDGVGGLEMRDAGLTSLFPMDDLSVMGFSDVMKRLPLLLWRVRQTIRHIMRTRPDCVVLIDSQEFSALVARGLRKRGFGGRVLLYVAPTVWAWRPERARKIKPLYDEILAVLPFEPEVMQRLGGPPCTYVGHPAIARFAAQPWHTKPTGKLAILPGSRGGEIRRHLQLFEKIVTDLGSHPAMTSVVLPTLPSMAEQLRQVTSGWPVAVEVVAGREERQKAFAESLVALASAGTVSLELALAGVPMVGTYVPDSGQMRLYEQLGRPDVLLPNIIAGHRFVPEIAPGEKIEARVASEVTALLDDPEARAAQQAEFGKLRDRMIDGLPEHKKEDATDRILQHIGSAL